MGHIILTQNTWRWDAPWYPYTSSSLLTKNRKADIEMRKWISNHLQYLYGLLLTLAILGSAHSIEIGLYNVCTQIVVRLYRIIIFTWCCVDRSDVKFSCQCNKILCNKRIFKEGIGIYEPFEICHSSQDPLQMILISTGLPWSIHFGVLCVLWKWYPTRKTSLSVNCSFRWNWAVWTHITI